MRLNKTLNLLINFSLVISAVVLTFIATEYFFYLNSSHSFISNKPRPVHSYQPTPIPEEIIASANKLYPSQLFDKADFDFKEDSKRLPLNVYSAIQSPIATNLINQRPSNRQAIQLQETRLNGDVLIYSQTYNMDNGHSRKSRAAPNDVNKKNFLALGCSLVFGVGVGDEQTITGQLAKQIPNYNFYNFGVPGGGLTEALDDIYFNDRASYINKRGGQVIYVFWWDHFRRFYAGVDIPHKDRISYEIKNDQLIRHVPYANSSNFSIYFLKKLERSYFMRYIGYGADIYSQENQQQFAEFIKHIRDFYAANYNLDFYFYFLNPESIPSEYFLDQLKTHKIKTISYQSIHEVFPTHETVIGGDGHTTEKGNYIFASKIRKAIRKDHPDF